VWGVERINKNNLRSAELTAEACLLNTVSCLLSPDD
jgi:hypothetical protein